eukprot:TRINITY_DN2048_c4_g1_i1.p1 TRINITY_DN2048_c4_g1~~TRINITY_DN2048_c4_g1_i1.p1  ORF type:complete len:716 (+),score=153.75 TRINITY_DN2048_c4_g1_i1:40-2187(+)
MTRLIAVLAAAGLAGGIKIVSEHRKPEQINCAAPANSVVSENCKEGNDAEEWDINAGGDPEIQGYATQQSYAPGDKVLFKIKTDSEEYTIDIYRVGYYKGKGARKVGGNIQHVKLPQRQPPCNVEDKTLLMDCGNWLPSAHWHIPSDVLSGVYFARLTRLDAKEGWRSDNSRILANPKFSNPAWDYSKPPPCGDSYDCPELEQSFGAQRRAKSKQALLRNALHNPHASHVYFVVRSSTPTDILFQTSDTTWHAYNTYGVPNTYGGYPLPHHNFSLPKEWNGRRSYKRSYNVPMLTRDTRSVNMLWGCEYPMIRWLERYGYDVSYWSGVDTDVRGEELKNFKIFLSVGHDEYWAGRQRKHVEDARDAGTHLAFFSGNELYWRIRWEPDAEGNPHRTMVVYKDTQASSKLDPSDEWTGTWRDANPSNPNFSPENALTGTIYTANAWRYDALEVPSIYSKLRFWRYTDVARLKPWEKAVMMKGLLGHEWDEDMDNGFRPKGLIRMSETTVDNVQMVFDAGAAYDSGTATHHLVMYKTESGALVFGAGTVQWMWGLDEMHDSPSGMPNQITNEYNTRIGVDQLAPEPAIQQATVNLFKDMSVLPTTPESHITINPDEVPDTTPPTCTITAVEGAGEAYEVVGSCTDPVADKQHGVVAGVEISFDGKRWHPVLSPLGAHHVTWTHPSPLSSYVAVRATDDSGNTGVPATYTPSQPLHSEL